ncbi:MAG: heavy-metal-associated domain-containing protein [Methanothrix sp.]|nr:heavy-metal-associated domain-containing protein [Methanothrix sp.]
MITTSSLAAFPALPVHCLRVDGMTCEHCQGRVEQAASGVAGVTEARVDLAAGTLTVRGGDPQAIVLDSPDQGSCHSSQI